MASQIHYAAASAPVPTEPAAQPASRRQMRPMTQADAQQWDTNIRQVWDASLGRYRSVRGDGEIVEACVSRDEQRRMMKQASTYVSNGANVGLPAPVSAQQTVSRQYTGKDLWPSQHPWWGMK